VKQRHKEEEEEEEEDEENEAQPLSWGNFFATLEEKNSVVYKRGSNQDALTEGSSRYKMAFRVGERVNIIGMTGDSVNGLVAGCNVNGADATVVGVNEDTGLFKIKIDSDDPNYDGMIIEVEEKNLRSKQTEIIKMAEPSRNKSQNTSIGRRGNRKCKIGRGSGDEETGRGIGDGVGDIGELTQSGLKIAEDASTTREQWFARMGESKMLSSKPRSEKRLFVVQPLLGSPQISCLSPALKFSEFDSHASITLSDFGKGPQQESNSFMKSSFSAPSREYLMPRPADKPFQSSIHSGLTTSIGPEIVAGQSFLDWHICKKQWHQRHSEAVKLQENYDTKGKAIQRTQKYIEDQWSEKVVSIAQEEDEREQRRWQATHDIRSRAMYVSEKRRHRPLLVPLRRSQLILK
jgi:hypothetical protein